MLLDCRHTVTTVSVWQRMFHDYKPSGPHHSAPKGKSKAEARMCYAAPEIGQKPVSGVC